MKNRSCFKANCNQNNVRRYCVELYPTEDQAKFFHRQIDLYRYVYNWALETEIANRDAGNKFIGRVKLFKMFSEYRNATPWLQEIPLNTARESISALLAAYDQFFEGKARFPRFKSKKTARKAFKTRNEQFAFRFYETSVRISGLPPRQFVHCGHHNLPTNKEAKFYQPTVIFDGYRWWLSVAVELNDTSKPFDGDESERINSIGIDLGVRTTIQLSTGESFQMPDTSRLDKRASRLRSKMDKATYERKQLAQRTITKYEDIPYSKNEKKRRHLFYKTCRRSTNIRHSFVHEVTTKIANMYPKRIVMEDLDVEDMIRNARSAKVSQAVKRSMFRAIRSKMEYKCQDRGIEFVLASQFYPSSQICSVCGHRHKDLSNSKTFVCPKCLTIIDRDLNAAINLSRYGLS